MDKERERIDATRKENANRAIRTNVVHQRHVNENSRVSRVFDEIVAYVNTPVQKRRWSRGREGVARRQGVACGGTVHRWEWAGRSLQAMIFAERALAVVSGLQVSLMNPLQLASFLKTCIIRCTKDRFVTCEPGSVSG